LSSGVRVGFVMAETDAHATHHEEADVRIGGVATQVRPGTGHRVFVCRKALGSPPFSFSNLFNYMSLSIVTLPSTDHVTPVNFVMLAATLARTVKSETAFTRTAPLPPPAS